MTKKRRTLNKINTSKNIDFSISLNGIIRIAGTDERRELIDNHENSG